MKLFLNPKDYGFHDSINYPEIHESFWTNTVVKTIAEHKDELYHHYWFIAIQVPSNDIRGGDERYEIMSGSFSKNKVMDENNWPRVVYNGLISSKEYGETLLKNLLGTLKNESVEVEGSIRLVMKCIYINQKNQNK